MAAKTQITNKGLELLASSSKATGQHWWIGWYALAFVPDELQDEDGEKIGPNMTKLTEEGDIIYNIFQGDMNGDGYQTTKASDKFKAVNYDSNIKKNYRYVLDEDGRNNLVTFVDGKNGLKGACVYPGVKVNESRDDNSIDYAKSKIPLPAPLLYTGVLAAGEGWSTNGMNIFLGTGNDRIENFYPVDKDSSDLTIPRVSADFRNYEGYKNGLKKRNDGEQAYAYALTDITDEGVDFDGWFPSVYTYTQNDDPTMDYNQFCKQYWKVLSISNFNKYCAPVNASGLLYDENTGCRNMAKATKYFPISDYSVTSTAKTADNEYATGIKLKVKLKLNGNAEDGAYFKDVEMVDEENVATLNPDATTEEHQLFNTQQVSFKFNRIGIYAVPMRQYGCSDDSSEMKAQYQIDTEAEPVLFAVCEWDSPVTLSDSGEGLSEFQSDVFIDLSAAVEDSSVIRESAVYYNLYEDDAIDWYKNQLLANASMAEALVNMQIEMGYLRNQKNAKQGCCPKQEAIQQTEKSGTGLRNLVDAKDYNSNSVRNRLAQEEGTPIGAIYSDVEPNMGAIGHPASASVNVFARESTDGTSTVYSAVIGAWADQQHAVDYGDAIFDGCTYINMLATPIVDYAKSIRIGNLWVRTSLYYEMYSFVKPSNPSSDNAWDYPDDADTNNYMQAKTSLRDYFGSGTLNTGLPYVIVKRTANGVTTTDDGVTITGLPSDLLSEVATSETVAELVNEINRSLENYETEREYIVYYYPGATSRSYDGYQCIRKSSVILPKIQLYRLNSAVFDEINSRIESTGWRIPTRKDWDSIISNTDNDEEKAIAIRSASKWTATGGTGDVYPLGGFAISRGSIQPSLYTGDDIIYLAIADDDLHVVAFDGTKFEIVGKTISGTEAGLSHVAILCVSDATVISEGTDKYKLGDDSYSLMEGSITEGNHNFNAGEKSVILASAHYNSIFGGMYNKIKDSDHNAILNGYHNELLGAVFSCVLGSGNVLKTSSGLPACRMLVDGTNTIVAGGATSLIFAENSYAESLYQSSVMGDACDIRNMYCSRFIGQSTSRSNHMAFSDVISHATHHTPSMIMSRAIVTDDHIDDLPSTLSYASTIYSAYSDIIAHRLHFLDKKDASTNNTSIDFTHLTTGADVGIVNTMAVYSDIVACGDASAIDSWFASKTLESVNIAYSDIKLCSAAITSAYIDGDVDNRWENSVNFCDISLGQSFIQLGESNDSHSFNYGVVKLSYSMISKCDCSYIYETGTRHFLTSAKVHYATLFGNLISLSSNYIQNTHIYGSLTLTGDLTNHIILGGLDGTSVGNVSASSYIAEFGSCITQNYKNYPMIWSMGGIGLYMNKMVLGNKGVRSSKAPSVGDVLSVVGVEDNVATVAWASGGGASGGSSDIIVFQDDGVVIPYKSGRQFATYNAENVATATSIRYSLFQNGQFNTFGNDANIPLFKTPITGSDVPHGLRPYGTNHIVWNTWYSIKAYATFDDDETTTPYVREIVNGTKGTIATGNNALSTMVVVTDALVEGLVYEVTINVRSIAKLSDSEAGSTAGTEAYGTMGAPSKFGTHFGLAFYTESGTSVTAKRWADNTKNVNYILYPRFNPVPSDGSGFGFGPGTSTGIQPPVIAAAKVYFVKVGSDIFVMAY